jgi:hypothetical protein
MSAKPADPAVDPTPSGRWPRWLRWSNGLVILLAVSLGLGLFGVIVGAFWVVTTAAYLLAASFFGFAAKAASQALASSNPALSDEASPGRD